jgi:hypothetical protein
MLQRFTMLRVRELMLQRFTMLRVRELMLQRFTMLRVRELMLHKRIPTNFLSTVINGGNSQFVQA